MEKLGINFIYLIAQIVNFGIIFFLLKRFLYKPLLNILDERRKRVEETLLKSEKIEKELSSLKEKETEILAKARRDSQKILEETRRSAEKLEKQLRDKAKQEADEIIKQTKEVIEVERKRAIQDIEDQAANLVVESTKRVLEDVLSEEQQREILKRTIENLKSEGKFKLS